MFLLGDCAVEGPRYDHAISLVSLDITIVIRTLRSMTNISHIYNISNCPAGMPRHRAWGWVDGSVLAMVQNSIENPN